MPALRQSCLYAGQGGQTGWQAGVPRIPTPGILLTHPRWDDIGNRLGC